MNEKNTNFYKFVERLQITNKKLWSKRTNNSLDNKSQIRLFLIRFLCKKNSEFSNISHMSQKNILKNFYKAFLSKKNLRLSRNVKYEHKSSCLYLSIQSTNKI